MQAAAVFKMNGSTAMSGDQFYSFQEKQMKPRSFPLMFVVCWFTITILVAVGVASLLCYVQIREYQGQIDEYVERLEFLEQELEKAAKMTSGAKETEEKGDYMQMETTVLSELEARLRRDVTEEPQESENCEPGPRGPPGAQGRDGVPGRDGRDGIPGMPGTPGAAGAAGPIGPRGDRGMKGQPGEPGIPGEKGVIGKSGPEGEKGERGSCGCDYHPSSWLQHGLPTSQGSSHGSSSSSSNDGNSSSSGFSNQPLTTGSMYVRWGRTTCPNTGAELVFEGLAAGSHYSHKGGSSNYECLPLDPEWGTYNDAWNSKSYIYGVEYEVSSFDPFSHENAEALHDHDVPCALCRVPTRGVKLMIPGKTQCPEKWTKEYGGYLVSGHYAHNAQFIFECVDESPEARLGTHASQDGALMYVVEAACGSLPCGPYVDGREMTCVVCTI
ncbi:short-chain collagen C4-like [Ptychodera flava]|uniref:short-chain collagen C4-like n=1 Tax=Ptychodera flava TaxID=63121 RepID=UPI003969CD32